VHFKVFEKLHEYVEGELEDFRHGRDSVLAQSNAQVLKIKVEVHDVHVHQKITCERK